MQADVQAIVEFLAYACCYTLRAKFCEPYCARRAAAATTATAAETTTDEWAAFAADFVGIDRKTMKRAIAPRVIWPAFRLQAGYSRAAGSDGTAAKARRCEESDDGRGHRRSEVPAGARQCDVTTCDKSPGETSAL